MEDCTGYVWSYFSKEKWGLKNVMLDFIKNLETKYGNQVKYVQCDHARIKEDFEWTCKVEGMSIEFEYTTSGTSQQLGCVEW